MNDELILVTSPDHPLTKKRKVKFADLASEAFIAHTSPHRRVTR
jgi:LysR substrate binding domain.